jgi:hypothetical protein
VAILPGRLASNDLMQQEPGVWVEGPDGELIPDYASTFPEINEGQVVHGTVVRVDKDEVLSRRAVIEEQRKEYRERILDRLQPCLIYTTPSTRDTERSRMPSSG